MLIYTSLFVQAEAMSYNVSILYMCFSQNASLGMAICVNYFNHTNL